MKDTKIGTKNPQEYFWILKPVIFIKTYLILVLFVSHQYFRNTTLKVKMMETLVEVVKGRLTGELANVYFLLLASWLIGELNKLKITHTWYFAYCTHCIGTNMPGWLR